MYWGLVTAINVSCYRTSSSEQTPPSRGGDSDFLISFRSLELISPSRRKESPATNNLQGYYGVKPPDHEVAPKECEMTVYHSGGSQYLEDSQFGKPTCVSGGSQRRVPLFCMDR